jgi:GrpB-like predicted nucleotidyltransferase (UPF0157 family)
VVQGNAAHRRHIQLRDHLRSQPDAAARFGELKRQLADAYGADRDGYTEAKSNIIREVLREVSGAGEGGRGIG